MWSTRSGARSVPPTRIWPSDLTKRHPLYETYRGMLRRCYNPRAHGFANYGGRGITVCQRWRRSFKAFITDVGARPPGLTLERLDNDGNYSPSNVAWRSRRDQSRNRRGNRRVTANGRTAVLADWGIPRSTINNRLKRGWSEERAVTQPPPQRRGQHSLMPAGSFAECQLRGLNWWTVKSRVTRGWSYERALNTPIGRTKR